jgi:uncharacterized membrane protein YhaH (DUF805 family)
MLSPRRWGEWNLVSAVALGAEPFTWSGFLFSFKGRIPRSWYWLRYALPYTVLLIVLTALDLALGTFSADWGLGLFSGLFSLLALWTSLAVAMKRCHDRDRSAWFLLIGLIPIVGGIWLLVELGFLRGTVGDNRFGPDPTPSP